MVKLSGKMFVLEKGRIVKSGSPQKIFAQHNVSGKFKFVGQVLDITKDSVLNILTLQIGENITKVVATDEEVSALRVGDKVMVASKAFNPLILKYPPDF